MKPIALTMGDPAGIGPEITAKTHHALANQYPLLFIGDPDVLQGCEVYLVDHPSAVDPNRAELAVLACRNRIAPILGAPDSKNATSVISSIQTAVDLTTSGATSAVVTNPIAKKVLRDGGQFPWPGHTEFLAHLTHAKRPVMMLAGPDLKVVPVTIHIPLNDVANALTPELIEETLRITITDLKCHFGIPAPRIAVSGLNPHAGEGGLMGDEDRTIIAPVIQKLATEGHSVFGPLPADTMFHARARADYDAAVCMYHDQALIPVKTLNFDEGVNVTLGLPIIRTSPDHGTAFDIAGQGIANPSSLIAAVRLAADMAAT